MGKNKLKRFEENAAFEHVFEPGYTEVLYKDYELKSKWRETFFKNENPFIIELACGKGEYTVGMAQLFADKNFMGIDVKGARIWRGAKRAFQMGMKNVAFLRTKIELIESFFAKDEIDEIWITFPDPQLKKMKKRLTSARFLMSYRKFLKADGTVNLKTDSRELYDFTMEVIKLNKLEIVVETDDLYASELVDDVLSIKTYYEGTWLEMGKKINYIKFRLNNPDELLNPEEED